MAKLTKEQYEKLIKSRTNAWAIWNDSFEEQEKSKRLKFEGVEDQLEPNVVFLGLNPSKKLEENNLFNFHNPKSRNDKKLKKAIQGRSSKDPICPNIFGGFMTDIVIDNFEPNSANVSIENVHSNGLQKTLTVLGQDSYHLICFGHKVYNAVQAWLLHEEEHLAGFAYGRLEKLEWDIKIYRVAHFAATVKIKYFNRQLRQVDKLVRKNEIKHST